jgi:hypothetical protein
MTAPWLLFCTLTLGLLAGGGVAVIAAPTAWLVSGLDAPEISRALTCAVAVLP